MDISARISGQQIYFFSFRESACKTEREVLEGETVWDLKYKNLNHRLRELAGQPRGLLFHLILAVRCSFTGDTWPQSKIQPEVQSSHKKELPLQTCKCRGATRQAGGRGGRGEEKWPLGGRSIDDSVWKISRELLALSEGENDQSDSFQRWEDGLITEKRSTCRLPLRNQAEGQFSGKSWACSCK